MERNTYKLQNTIKPLLSVFTFAKYTIIIIINSKFFVQSNMTVCRLDLFRPPFTLKDSDLDPTFEPEGAGCLQVSFTQNALRLELDSAHYLC